MSTSIENESDVRARQVRVLKALAERMIHGDQLLPADIMSRVIEELELRVDEEAVSTAWSEQVAQPPCPWRGEMARASRRARGREVREVLALERLTKDLEKLSPNAREEVSLEIDALAFDPLPRGATALHGRKDDHVQLRIGALRLLYKAQGNSVVVVAVTGNDEG